MINGSPSLPGGRPVTPKRPRPKPTLCLHDPESNYNVYHAVRASMPEVADPRERERIEDLAIERICDIRLQRSFVLPADAAKGRPRPLRVSYSDVGSSDPNAPVLLWASGMFGGRFTGVELLDLAEAHGIRLISVDRPGIGGSEAVPINQRIATWLEIVPALLKHLKIKHVSLGCHSAGTIYVLSTIIHLRHILRPERPYVCMFGPWVAPQYSGKLDMKIVSLMPKAMLRQWHVMAKTVFNIDKSITPGLSHARTMIRKVGGAINSSSGTINPILSVGGDDPMEEIEPSTTGDSIILPKHGPIISHELLVATTRLATASIFAENLEGASDEALVCMGKADIPSWISIGHAIEQVAGNELATRTGSEDVPPKLRIDVFYGMKDQMIGKGGEEFLEMCLDKAYEQGAIDCSSMVIGNTDHNSVLYPETGAFDLVFEAMNKQPENETATNGA